MTDFLAIADKAINEHGAMQKRAELAALLALAVELVDPTDLGPAGNHWGGIGVVLR